MQPAYTSTLRLSGLTSHENTAATKTLSEARPGEQLTLSNVNANKRVKERLVSMGFPTGCSFTVQHNNRGSVVIGCACNRLAIGKGMADKIKVQQVA